MLHVGSTAGASAGDTLLGEATITAVQENASFASFKGTETPKTGDFVKPAPKK